MSTTFCMHAVAKCLDLAASVTVKDARISFERDAKVGNWLDAARQELKDLPVVGGIFMTSSEAAKWSVRNPTKSVNLWKPNYLMHLAAVYNTSLKWKQGIGEECIINGYTGVHLKNNILSLGEDIFAVELFDGKMLLLQPTNKATGLHLFQRAEKFVAYARRMISGGYANTHIEVKIPMVEINSDPIDYFNTLFKNEKTVTFQGKSKREQQTIVYATGLNSFSITAEGVKAKSVARMGLMKGIKRPNPVFVFDTPFTAVICDLREGATSLPEFVAYCGKNHWVK